MSSYLFHDTYLLFKWRAGGNPEGGGTTGEERSVEEEGVQRGRKKGKANTRPEAKTVSSLNHHLLLLLFSLSLFLVLLLFIYFFFSSFDLFPFLFHYIFSFFFYVFFVIVITDVIFLFFSFFIISFLSRVVVVAKKKIQNEWICYSVVRYTHMRMRTHAHTHVNVILN